MPIINADPDKTLDTVVDMLNDKVTRMDTHLMELCSVPDTQRDHAKVSVLLLKTAILQKAVDLIKLV